MNPYTATVTAAFEKTILPFDMYSPSRKVVLKDLFPDWQSNDALFDKLVAMPWDQLTSTGYLNRLYFGFHSGYKRPSTYLANWVQKWENGSYPFAITKVDMENIAGDISFMYKDKWTRLFEMYMMRVDPMNNFHWKEEHTGNNAEDSSSTTKTEYGRTQQDKTTTQSSDTRTGNITDNTNMVGSTTNTKTLSGSESTTHDTTRDLVTGTQESGNDTTTRSGTVKDTGATARYGFDSLVTGEGEPYDRKVSSTDYNNVQDKGQKWHVSAVHQTGTDGYTDHKSFANRQDTDTQTYNGRADNNTVTYNDVTDSTNALTDKTYTSGGSDKGTETGSRVATQSHTTEITGYRFMNYFDQVQKAFDTFKDSFFETVFKDIDKMLANSFY